MKISEPWKYKVRFGGSPESLRERIADLLRSLASFIDGRLSVAVQMDSTPYINTDNRLQCLNKGFAHTERLYEEEVKAEALEAGMKRAMPELYND